MVFRSLVPLEMFVLAGTRCLYSFHSGRVASGEYVDLFLNSQLALKSLHSFAVDKLLDSSEALDDLLERQV